MPKAFLFDLDMTLVNSSALEGLRRVGLWDEVLKNCHRITPFIPIVGFPPHELPGQLRSKGFKVGIVTSSIRRYAAAVIKQFRISYDTLVTYEDTAQHKPDPEPIQLAMQHLGIAPADGVYVGDAPTDFEAAYHAGLWSIGVGWANVDWGRLGPNAPDMMLHTPKLLLKSDKLPRQGYYGDVLFQNSIPSWHRGSLLKFNGMLSGFALGRYFATGDPRHANGGLSAAILSLKDDDTHSKAFSSALIYALQHHNELSGFDFITAVPPKPGMHRDRFQPILLDLSRISGVPRVVCDGLRCIKNYGDLKSITDPLARQEAVKGVFRTKYSWKTRKILLLDDVMTTGSTASECIRTLRRNGAVDVQVITLGKDQIALTRKICSACGRIMRIRKRGRDGVMFWGCSGYPTFCKHTENA